MKKCRKTKKKWIKFFITIAIIIVAVLCYLHFYVNPLIVNSNTAYIKSTTTKVVNDGLIETLAQSDYDDLVSIEKDSNGDVSVIKVNSSNVNKLNSDIVKSTQTLLENNTNLHIDVPIGTFTGLPILNGVGKKVQLKITPIGSVETKFISRFTSVAINQSCHKIMLNITADVCVLLPLYTQNITVTLQVLVAECIIVGEVPSVYLNTDNLTNALNLIPQ